MSGKDLLALARRVSNELMLWFVMSSISLGISASVISDAVKAVIARPPAQQILANALLAAFGAGWFLLSLTLMHNICHVERKHGFFLAVRLRRGVLSADSVADFVKDVISLYRGYRWLIVSVGVTALVVGASMVACSIYYYVTGVAEVSESLFRLFIGAIVLSYAALSLHVEEAFMARKLAKVRSIEDRLSEFLK